MSTKIRQPRCFGRRTYCLININLDYVKYFKKLGTTRIKDIIGI